MKTILTGSVSKAAKFIRQGDVCAFPTETVYGLGASAFDEKAVRKIFKAKGRPADNPLIVHIAMKKDIYVLAEEVNLTAKKIIKKFFPGPVTVILKKNPVIPDIVTSALGTIAVRMPGLTLTRDFIKACGVPVAAPSANISGSPSPTSFIHVLQDFRGKIPCMLTGPDTRHGLESTVIDCTVNPPVVLRPGVITIEQLRKIDKRIKTAPGSKIIKSPGQKYRHYAPKAKVRLIADYKFRIKDIESNAAYIGLKHLPAGLRNKIIIYYKAKSVNDYAKNLFAFFRSCDSSGIKTIYAGAVDEKGIGLAIMNRLKKAVKN